MFGKVLRAMKQMAGYSFTLGADADRARAAGPERPQPRRAPGGGEPHSAPWAPFPPALWKRAKAR
jgi:hypothetical protein